MDLEELRKQIDAVDERLVCDIRDRMDIAARIGRYKTEHGIPVFDPEREDRVMQKIVRMADNPEQADYLRRIYTLLFELSRSHQNSLHDGGKTH